MKKPPLYKKIEMQVDPYQGMGAIATSITEKGYAFYKMTRKGTKATITLRRID